MHAMNKIEVKSIMILTKAIFEPGDYDTLKNFYSAIIKKENEIIVFKKKNWAQVCQRQTAGFFTADF